MRVISQAQFFWRILRSCVALVVIAPARNWSRHPLLVTPAVASTTFVLLTAAAVAIGSQSAASVYRQQVAEASFVRFYLRADAGTDAIAQLTARLRADPRVAGITFVSSQDALRRASAQPGMSEVIADAGSNPFPASLDVRVRNLNYVGRVATDYGGDGALDPVTPSSYDSGSYVILRKVAYIAAAVAAIVLALLGAIAVGLTATAVRAATVARREEILVMRLVGASRVIITGSFLTEGALTGALAGLLAALLVVILLRILQLLAGPYLPAVLPGVSMVSAVADVAILPIAGIVLAAPASLLAARGVIE